MLFSVITLHIQGFLAVFTPSVFSFFVVQEADRHDSLVCNSSACFQSTLNSCIVLSVLQQWHPVLSSFQRCVT
jgi:hypothetical protein